VISKLQISPTYRYFLGPKDICVSLNISPLRHEVAYFDFSVKVLCLCLNSASRLRSCGSMRSRCILDGYEAFLTTCRSLPVRTVWKPQSRSALASFITFFNRYRLCWFAKYYLQPVERGLIFFVSNIGVYYSSCTIKAKSMIL
jgi:hypothetical protein